MDKRDYNRVTNDVSQMNKFVSDVCESMPAKGLKLIASAVVADGAISFDASLASDGLYMVTVGNSYAFVPISEAGLAMSSTYPIRVSMPLIFGNAESKPANLLVGRNDDEGLIYMSLTDGETSVPDGYTMNVYRTELF